MFLMQHSEKKRFNQKFWLVGHWGKGTISMLIYALYFYQEENSQINKNIMHNQYMIVLKIITK